MSWLVADWRMKLLALVLTMGLLGAVAFSENPVEFRTLAAKVDYAGLRDGLAILNPQGTVNVQVTGLATAVSSLTPDNIEVRADVSKLKSNEDRTISATVTVLVPNVTATTSNVSVHVVTDTIQQRALDIDVRMPNVATGWAVDTDPKKTFAQCQPDTNVPCKVTVTGPTSLTQGVTAYVDIQQTINASLRIPSQTVRFERNGQPVDFTRISTTPKIGWDPPVVGVQITANRGSAQRTVGLNVPVTGRPACGYGVAAVSITPGNGVVTITGPADAITSRDSVGTGPVDVNGATGNVTRTLAVQAPDQVTAQPASVQVTVTIQKQFDCAAPTPTPTPRTSPSP